MSLAALLVVLALVLAVAAALGLLVANAGDPEFWEGLKSKGKDFVSLEGNFLTPDQMKNSSKKKTWIKSKEIIVTVGKCKYCQQEIVNTDSFVSFYKSGHAHYTCMKNDHEKRSESHGE